MKTKPIIWLVAALALAGALFVGLRLFPEPNAELKRTNRMKVEDIDPSAMSIVEAALDAIKARSAKNLLAVLSNRDEVMLEAYAEELFKGEEFAPAEIKEARSIEKSTQGAIVIIVHSNPRDKDYEFTLIQKNGKYAVKGIH